MGKTQREIAKELDISQTSVYFLIKKVIYFVEKNLLKN